MLTTANIHTASVAQRETLERELGIMSHVEGVRYRLARPDEHGWTMRVDNVTFWITDDGALPSSTVFSLELDGFDTDVDLAGKGEEWD